MGYFCSFLFRFLALHFLLNSLQKNAAFQSGTPTQSSDHFHIVEVSSLLPASTCSPFSARVSSEEESLKLVHNYGPCSPRNHGKANAPSMLEILEQDQKRVSFIASRQRHGKNNIQVRWDGIMNNGQYVVNVGLGMPKRELTLMIDTGSSLIWTQCRPCKLLNLKGCYKQRHPIFNPLKSSTYSNITCPSHTCSMTNATLGSSTCVSSTCVYVASYVDGASAGGFLAKERLTVGSKRFNGIIFGCNEGNIDNSLPGIDGLIGLGGDFLSFVEQTAKTYKRVFSYCLPSTTSEIGFLKFGKAKRVSKSLKYTKLGADYAIQVVGIKLGNTTIPIAVKNGAASIDSGTTVSRIPPKAYTALRKAYRKAMSRYHLLAETLGAFDTCYHVGRHQKLRLPKMSFVFADGLVLDIPRSGIALPLTATIVCLPFAAPPGGDDIVLLGNIQQQTLEIVYDVARGKLGFGYGGCK